LPAILIAFARVALRTRLIYRSAYWMTAANMLMRMFAVGAIWDTLARTKPEALQVGRADIVSYGILAVVLAQVLTWWEGPHSYITDRVQDGSITTDLRWPIYFPLQIFARTLGDTLAQLLSYALPAYIFGVLLLGLRLPASPQAAAFFCLGLVLSYILMFQFNFLLGLVSFFTLRLTGIQHAYHGMISLLSGLVIPIWLFPEALQPVVNWLPFRSLFGNPASLYIGQLTGAQAWMALGQSLIWALILGVVIVVAWNKTNRHVVVQGG